MDKRTDQRFTCTGRGAASQEECDFTTNNPEAAMHHFEELDHDVDDRENDS